MGFLIPISAPLSSNRLLSFSSSFSNLSPHNRLVLDAGVTFLEIPSSSLECSVFFIHGWWPGSEGSVIKNLKCLQAESLYWQFLKKETKDGGEGAENRGLDDHETWKSLDYEIKHTTLPAFVSNGL